MMYKVKNIKRPTGVSLQLALEYWIESRDHVEIQSINVWCDKEWHYATITYREEQYVG